MSGRDGLITRILQVRRSALTVERRPRSTAEGENGVVRALETRVTQLEQLVQGLQDSVHREALRQDKRITQLEARIHPAALSKALSKDARDRGL